MLRRMHTPTLADYLRLYAEDHQHPLNRLTHLFGIPMIVASLPLLVLRPRVGFSLFGAGWALQFLGHHFEGKRPSFTRDPRYLAVGPLWIAREWLEILTGRSGLHEECEEQKAPDTTVPRA